MRKSWSTTFVGFVLWMIGFTDPTRAVTFHIGASSGVMQQPTSHYYHFVYGGYAEVANSKRGLIGRIRYSERPTFESDGFKDDENGAFATIGTTALKTRYGALHGFFGGGTIRGSIQSKTEPSTLRSYELSGVTTEMDWIIHFRNFEIGLQHQAFVGLASQTEVESYVGWPFNFYRLAIGTNF